MNRFTLHRVFIGCSVIAATLSFIIADAQLGGLALAGGAVFFALFMMFNFLKNEKTDKELADEALYATNPSADAVAQARPVASRQHLAAQNAHLS